MDIRIPEEQWGAMIGSAVLQSVTKENRDLLIQEAIRYLLTKQSKGYGENQSPLQEAFREAVRFEARKIVGESLATDVELLTKLKALVAEAVEKATTGDNRTKLVDKMADAISSAFKLDQY